MEIKKLKLNNLLQKESKNKLSNYGAENIITGTVITSCFLQTSSLPSRIEMSGNDLIFYDDTRMEAGEVVGDTAKMVFTHDQNSDEGFIIEKRGSTSDTYDNVFSLYATPAKTGRQNMMFIGRDGRKIESLRNLGYLEMSVNGDSEIGVDSNNGTVGFTVSIEGKIPTTQPVSAFYVGSILSGKTGVGANLVGIGDATDSNDLGQATVTFLDTNSGTAPQGIVVDKNGIQMSGLPTSATGLSTGTIWNNSGVLTIV